ncbi:MAG TPA: hypothetical protein VIJ75_00140 [Hanamia sp.]
MKKKFKLSVFAITCLLSLGCFHNSSYAQTAVNSIKISGGEFGIGTTLVFPDEGTVMNQVQYVAATSDGKTTITINSNEVKYKGKEINLMLMVTLQDGKSAGNYTLENPNGTPPPPNAEVSVRIGADEGITGHEIISESGNVNLTAFGGPSNFLIGTFSGLFYEGVDGKINKYQVSGKFKAYRMANDEN